jgi:Zn-dependent M28 family amino/carboxypeptidase
MRIPALLVLLFSSFARIASAADAAADPATLARIRDAAMQSGWAYERLADLTDKIGGRLSGSPQAEAAVEQVAAAMRQQGFTVRLEPVMVPHWVRGEERAEIVAFPGQIRKLTQRLVLTALGGSGATPPQGEQAEVVVVKSLDELKAKGAGVSGKIVLIDTPFDTHLQDNGYAGAAYGQAGQARFPGPAVAAKLGARAVLVRSISGANYRMPHTGVTGWDEGQAPIPAAAVSSEDAELIGRLASKGPVTIKLLLTPQTLPDVESANVIAELPGGDLKDEIVLVSGHLDAWDIGHGAIDDGAGVVGAMGALYAIKSLGLTPRRTIRFVAWMNEENGARGEKAYTAAHQNAFAKHAAVIEGDNGAGRPLGIKAYASAAAVAALAPVIDALRPLGATVLEMRINPVASDLGSLQKAGIPGFEPLLDTRNYFDYHHTAADTLDKVDPENLRRQVAVFAVLTWFLADAPQMLERMPVRK